MKRVLAISLMIAVVVLVEPRGAEAYVGPGAGITVIGTLIALVGAILLAIIGFVWYPIKRLRTKHARKSCRIDEETTTP